MNTKKSFLLYFDNYPMVAGLPAEQRGWLLTALMVYGDRVWRDESCTMEEVLDMFPQMSPEARIVCGFMGANILRDTQRWLSRQRYAESHKQEGSRKQGGDRKPPARAQRDPVEEENIRKTAERMALSRRILEQMG